MSVAYLRVGYLEIGRVRTVGRKRGIVVDWMRTSTSAHSVTIGTAFRSSRIPVPFLLSLKFRPKQLSDKDQSNSLSRDEIETSMAKILLKHQTKGYSNWKMLINWSSRNVNQVELLILGWNLLHFSECTWCIPSIFELVSRILMIFSTPHLLASAALLIRIASINASPVLQRGAGHSSSMEPLTEHTVFENEGYYYIINNVCALCFRGWLDIDSY